MPKNIYPPSKKFYKGIVITGTSLHRLIQYGFNPTTSMLAAPRKCTITDFIYYRFAVIIYKCLNCDMPHYLTSKLSVYNPTRDLRSANDILLNKPLSTSGYSDRSFSILAPTIWNNLPSNIRFSPTLDTFKIRLKKHLLSLM